MQGKEAARRLRCGLCGASWFYPRLQCAVCQNDDYRSIGIIRVDGEEEKYRLQTCELCQGYIKIVITFEPTPFDLLAVEDLATLHLDLIADERGFSRTPVR
jgi:FdhE protein